MITWEGKKEQIFEMPTGGAAIMRQGPNLLKLARKEQCLALLTQLRTKFKTDGFIYRVFPNGEVQYLHPKDGVYPEKVNAGRSPANANMRRIGANVVRPAPEQSAPPACLACCARRRRGFCRPPQQQQQTLCPPPRSRAHCRSPAPAALQNPSAVKFTGKNPQDL